jgi:hypothetical protein
MSCLLEGSQKIEHLYCRISGELIVHIVAETLELRINFSAHYGVGLLAGVRQPVGWVRHEGLKFGTASNLFRKTGNGRPDQVRTG